MIILVPETGPQEAPQVIKKRGNSWWVVVYTGRDPLTGKKRQKTGSAPSSSPPSPQSPCWGRWSC